VLEAQLNTLMIRMSRQVTVVADSSKFDQRSLSVIAGLGDIDRVITDDGAEPQLLSALRAQDIDVTIV
jgi:DeoR family transcriptional regulator, aga operon transcriptional repressor